MSHESDRTLRYITGPGHGWLKVHHRLVRRVGIADKVSKYSFMSPTGRFAFLEEDCDMPLFLNAAKAAGIDIDIVDEYDPDELVRVNPRFIPAAFGKPRRSTVPNSTLSS